MELPELAIKTASHWRDWRNQNRAIELGRERKEGVGHYEQAEWPFKAAWDKFTIIISIPLQSSFTENPEFGMEVNVHKP